MFQEKGSPMGRQGTARHCNTGSSVV